MLIDPSNQFQVQEGAESHGEEGGEDRSRKVKIVFEESKKIDHKESEEDVLQELDEYLMIMNPPKEVKKVKEEKEEKEEVN